MKIIILGLLPMFLSGCVVMEERPEPIYNYGYGNARVIPLNNGYYYQERIVPVPVYIQSPPQRVIIIDRDNHHEHNNYPKPTTSYPKQNQLSPTMQSQQPSSQGNSGTPSNVQQQPTKKNENMKSLFGNK